MYTFNDLFQGQQIGPVCNDNVIKMMMRERGTPQLILILSSHSG